MESNSLLLLVEVDIVLLNDLFLCCGVNVKKSLNNLLADDILLDYLFNVIDLNETVERVLGIDFYERTL